MLEELNGTGSIRGGNTQKDVSGRVSRFEDTTHPVLGPFPISDAPIWFVGQVEEGQAGHLQMKWRKVTIPVGTLH